jgi:perosamine synthetase
MNVRLSGNEEKYVLEVLQNGFRGTYGSVFVSRLEEEIKKQYGVEFAISFNNGTATMHAALEALGVGVGDEVIVPPLTMASTAFVVMQANATPVFADVDRETFCISPDSIKQQITEKTKAIITVALYGLSPDMDAIQELVSGTNIKIIEDNAETYFSKYKNRLVGTIGDCSSFSFQSSKHLTSGEGGVVLTNDEKLATSIRRIQSLGYAGVGPSKAKISKLEIQEPGYDRHICMGWNYRMPELCAAVALGQVERANELVSRRVDSANLFKEVLDETKCDWLIPQRSDPEYFNSYWAFSCKMTRDDITWTQFRDKFMSFGGRGIYSAWKLTYLEPMFTNHNFLGRERFMSNQRLDQYKMGLCPVAESIVGQIMQFKTNFWDLSEAEVEALALRKTIEHFDG